MMIEFKHGDRVHWTDPDGDLCSGDGTVVSDDTVVSDGDEIIAIKKDDGGEVGALPEELTLLERTSKKAVVFNVLFETNYENDDDVHSTIETFDGFDKACKCLEDALEDEKRDGCYTEDELETRLVRDGYDHFCFYKDDSLSNWKFRATIYENKVK